MPEKTERKQIKKRSLFREEIRDIIMEAILSNELKSGDRIVETRWAKELGVSQSPVREAIRELELVGLIETRPFQGSYVKEITAKDVSDSQRVRESLEELAVTDAVTIISDEQLKELYNILKEMENAAKNHELNLFVQKDTLFHQRIIEVSKNETLLRLWNQCNIREWTFIITKLSDKTLEFLAVRHQEIYDALLSRDKKKAVKAVTDHFGELIELFKDLGLNYEKGKIYK